MQHSKRRGRNICTILQKRSTPYIKHAQQISHFHVACSAHLLEMPKRKGKQRGRVGGGRGLPRPPRGEIGTPAGRDVWRVGEGEEGGCESGDDEVDPEQLEGLEVKAMEMISKMGLCVSTSRNTYTQ